jgi:hypothetical protein
MADERYEACSYRIVRYVPNLLRDEWLNVGVVLHDRARNRVLSRFLAEQDEFARVRRLHPEADMQILRAVPTTLESLFSSYGSELEGAIEKLDSTLSNVLQFGPQKGVLTEDAEGELERLWTTQVAPPASRPHEAAFHPDTRAGLHARVNESFRRAGILARLERGIRVERYTFPGDPLRLDYSYGINGTRGYIHALPLLRDPQQPKSLAFTAERIRAESRTAQFHAIVEGERRETAERHRSITGFLREQEVEVVPVTELPAFTERLRQLIA